MKKQIALLLIMVMAFGLLAGCAGTTVVNNYYYYYYYGEEGNTGNNGNNNGGNTNPTEKPDYSGEGALKTGLVIMPTVKTTNATDANGKVEYDITFAAVLVDDKGIIADCIIDSLGATVEFDATGALKSDVTKELATKNELGDDYNMVAWGGAKAEWYVQVEYFANYCIGKTVDQVLAGYSEDVDLTTSATIKLDGYAQAVAAAVENAKHLGAKAGDELKMATVNSLSASANNAIELDCDMVVMTMKDGIITSCYLDALQAKVAVDANGAATVGNTQTKNELGDNYNMVAWGGAKYEWYQQAENFCAYVTGKTPADVAGISVNESTKPADGTDLATTVTIAIAGFQALVAKAAG